MECEARASPVQGEVGKIEVFGRRGCKKKNNPSVKIGFEEPILTAPFTQG